LLRESDEVSREASSDMMNERGIDITKCRCEMNGLMAAPGRTA